VDEVTIAAAASESAIGDIQATALRARSSNSFRTARTRCQSACATRWGGQQGASLLSSTLLHVHHSETRLSMRANSRSLSLKSWAFRLRRGMRSNSAKRINAWLLNGRFRENL